MTDWPKNGETKVYILREGETFNLIGPSKGTCVIESDDGDEKLEAGGMKTFTGPCKIQLGPGHLITVDRS